MQMDAFRDRTLEDRTMPPTVMLFSIGKKPRELSVNKFTEELQLNRNHTLYAKLAQLPKEEVLEQIALLKRSGPADSPRVKLAEHVYVLLSGRTSTT
jgi:hypothetical protein